MKMKKTLYILLTTMITAGMLAGCGKANVPGPEAGAVADTTDADITSEASKYAGQTPEEIL